MRAHAPRIPLLILTAAILALGAKSCVIDLAVVEGDSMLPRYKNGDVVAVLRCAYGLKVPLGFPGGYILRWAQPRVGDVVAAARPGRSGAIIKRVAEVGPLTLEVQAERLVGGHLDLGLEAGEAAILGSRVILPENSIFLLGDNLAASLDSRSFGPLPMGMVYGRVLGGPLFGPRPPRGSKARRRRP